MPASEQHIAYPMSTITKLINEIFIKFIKEFRKDYSLSSRIIDLDFTSKNKISTCNWYNDVKSCLIVINSFKDEVTESNVSEKTDEINKIFKEISLKKISGFFTPSINNAIEICDDNIKILHSALAEVNEKLIFGLRERIDEAVKLGVIPAYLYNLSLKYDTDQAIPLAINISPSAASSLHLSSFTCSSSSTSSLILPSSDASSSSAASSSIPVETSAKDLVAVLPAAFANLSTITKQKMNEDDWHQQKQNILNAIVVESLKEKPKTKLILKALDVLNMTPGFFQSIQSNKDYRALAMEKLIGVLPEERVFYSSLKKNLKKRLIKISSFDIYPDFPEPDDKKYQGLANIVFKTLYNQYRQQSSPNVFDDIKRCVRFGDIYPMVYDRLKRAVNYGLLPQTLLFEKDQKTSASSSTSSSSSIEVDEDDSTTLINCLVKNIIAIKKTQQIDVNVWRTTKLALAKALFCESLKPDEEQDQVSILQGLYVLQNIRKSGSAPQDDSITEFSDSMKELVPLLYDNVPYVFVGMSHKWELSNKQMFRTLTGELMSSLAFLFKQLDGVRPTYHREMIEKFLSNQSDFAKEYEQETNLSVFSAVRDIAVTFFPSGYPKTPAELNGENPTPKLEGGGFEL